MGLTTDKNSECLNETKDNGQNECYLVLSEEELAKGFTRPFRDYYIHVGTKVEKEGTIESLEEHLEGMSDTAKSTYTKENGYVGFLKYGEDRLPITGRYIKQDELDTFNSDETHINGCGTLTKMNKTISETYARDPKFYGATFCIGCGTHLPVSEFVWDGTDELVGS